MGLPRTAQQGSSMCSSGPPAAARCSLSAQRTLPGHGHQEAPGNRPCPARQGPLVTLRPGKTQKGQSLSNQTILPPPLACDIGEII